MYVYNVHKINISSRGHGVHVYQVNISSRGHGVSCTSGKYISAGVMVYMYIRKIYISRGHGVHVHQVNISSRGHGLRAGCLYLIVPRNS